ncbi:MAG: helix-turn-helix domain-containing protein [Parafannyhessea sp.]|uniref:helix-turn-helix domain-containing protein n=1 Tax=Parafannyhessea sp. TaxID=2847324 RepID=UPI003F022655
MVRTTSIAWRPRALEARTARARRTAHDAQTPERADQPYLPLGVLDYEERVPEGGSAALVYAFCTGREAVNPWAVPDGCVDLSFGIGPSDVVVTIGGTVSSARAWSFSEGRSWVGCRFRSGEALLPHGLAPEDLVDADVALDRDITEGPLATRLFEADDQEERMRLLECELRSWQREDGAPVGMPGSEHVRAVERVARQEIQRTGGRATVASVAQEAGVSPRYLRRAFAEVHGFSPKLYARFVRFQHAMSLIAHPREGASASEIALACGYNDQSHLVHEFDDFAGMTPGQFRSLVGATA